MSGADPEGGAGVACPPLLAENIMPKKSWGLAPEPPMRPIFEILDLPCVSMIHSFATKTKFIFSKNHHQSLEFTPEQPKPSEHTKLDYFKPICDEPLRSQGLIA